MADVAVIGGGVAGIQAALDIANHRIHVHLIEKEPTIGGHMAMLDKTFPTNDCSMCILSPRMNEVLHHPCITLHTCTEVVRVSGEAGNFQLVLKRHPRYVDVNECTGCGDCVEICPIEVYNRFDAGIGVRKAIYKPHPQAIPDVVVKDSDHCIECGLCYDICDRGAIRREDAAEEIPLTVDCIVVATGYQQFDPARRPALGYLRLPDVITSLEFERMINASGPSGGRLRRLSDGKTPTSVVFIQCVGSRDAALGRPWCSGTCCMAAIKHAILIREKHPECEVTICYIDIRAYGKGYEEYYQRAERLGVRFLRGMPAEVVEGRDGMVLCVENTENREYLELHPDLVVLSVGVGPSPTAESVAERLGIEQDGDGFFKPLDAKLGPVQTLKPGIYVVGAATGPRDIPDCVAQGEAAAMRVLIDIAGKCAGC